jgi:methylated-DNA-protein-cysteine methyltransferase-like protein
LRLLCSEQAAQNHGIKYQPRPLGQNRYWRVVQMQYTRNVNRSERYQRFYAVVSQIPPGKVATYGQVAILAGYPGQARQVGYALNTTPDDLEIPWQRVINAQGQISLRANPIEEEIQRQMLEAEGVTFNAQGRVPLSIYQWHPKSR